MIEENIPVLTLKKGREKSLIRRHPWIFSGAVGRLPEAPHGAIVQVMTENNNQLIGYGHFDAHSQIVCRMFEFTDKAISFEGNYWTIKFRDALALRKLLFHSSETTGYRLIHAEGDLLPGIIADIYGNCASVQLRTAGAIPL